ncbi:hypothetical protein C0993_005565 [Termitomyces sp. T159_Od127]|nr:hypothetical protein C0993_005565 [Termitomyces sp. T159_Od127]
MDYRHHWQDVLVGSVLGTVVSYFAYRQYYPSLASELSHRPYSPRIKRESVEILPTHHETSTGNHNEMYNLNQPQGTFGDTGGFDLSGTVQRPDLPLEEVWQDGANEMSAPRSINPAKHSRSEKFQNLCENHDRKIAMMKAKHESIAQTMLHKSLLAAL